MSNYGFIQLPRSLFHDPLWIGLTTRERHVFEILLIHVVFSKYEMDDHGVLIKINPGQYLTTERDFANLCNEFKPKDMKKIERNFVARTWSKLNYIAFLSQKVSHKKTLLTITRKDIVELIEPRSEPRVSQSRAKSEPQTKNGNKDDKEDNHNKTDEEDCGNVDNLRTKKTKSEESYQHSPQSSLSSFLDNSSEFSFIVFEPSTYRLKDGKSLTQRTQNALKKYTDENWERMVNNVKYYEHQCNLGIKIRTTHEQFLQDCINNDYATKEINIVQNTLYAQFCKNEYKLSIDILKTVVHLKKTGEPNISLPLNLPPLTFENAIDNFKEATMNGAYA